MQANLRALRSCTKAKICAVVKANVYGHGLKALAAFWEADEFAVSSAGEAAEVCRYTDKPVNILSSPDRTVACRYDANMFPAVSTPDDILFVTAHGGKAVNIKLNSGMNRYGADPAILEQMLRAADARHLQVKSVFSHIYDLSAACAQFEAFSQSVYPLRDYIPQKHILSGNFVRLPDYMHLDMVRPGLVLYGYGHESVRSAATATCGVTQVRQVPQGENIGYGHWPSEIARSVAVLGAGYADGVRRIAGNTPRYVIIGGHLCRVVGQICMDAMMADVRGLAVEAGDTATVLGDGYGFEAAAAACDTIAYEILTSLSARVERNYIEN